MSIKAAIYHLTHYKYDRPVLLAPQIIRLKPAPHSRTRVLSHSLRVFPAEHFVNLQQDPYGNWLSRHVFPEPVSELRIEVDLVADMTVYNPFDFFVEESAETWPFEYPEALREDLSIYMRPQPAGPLLAEFLKAVDRTPRNTVTFVTELNALVQRSVGYIVRLETGVFEPDETLARAQGSCRDSGWLLVEALRHLGFAARFVSGYLIQLKPDLVSLDGPPGTDHDFTDLHAWCEVYLPGAGWIGLDPTSGLLTGESHIPLAATPHYRNAAPISGAFSAVGPVHTDFAFDMKVSRIAEHPRITKPFSDESWSRLNALGRHVDSVLEANDVRLTMGGEPTFVSIDDFESGEWNADAVGPTKRARADTLIRRLRQAIAPGGFLHYGQGKWYPGESLPRWTFSLFWRRDGQPIWRDDRLVAREAEKTAATDSTASQFLHRFAEHLGLGGDTVDAAYEDPGEWLLKEARLPANVDPLNSELADAEARARMAAVFDRGLDRPTGYVLPVQRWNAIAAQSRWVSEKWRTRRGRLFLTPGDSPVGYRLPLSSLKHLAPTAYPHVMPRDPLQPVGELPPAEAMLRAREQPTASFTADAGGQQERTEQVLSEIEGSVRTAVAVEVRDGHLCVFLPPVAELEDYLELVAAVEASAAAHGQPEHKENKTPPKQTPHNHKP
ncbi:MAG: transglutaminase family protein, partial [Devosia sp.]